MRMVQVAKIRSSGIRTVHGVREDGVLENRSQTLTVKFPAHCLDAATLGSIWSITGVMEHCEYTVNGISITEELIHATEARFLRPSGELLVRWIAANIDGIGDVIARRLVRALPNLNEIVHQGNVEALTVVSGVNEERAKAIIEKWPPAGLYAVLDWLQESGLPMGLADRLIRVYKEETLDKIKVNPFILAAFGVPFFKIIELIRRLELIVLDQHLLAAIAEHVTSRYCLRTGSTAIPANELLTDAAKIARKLDISIKTIIEVALKQGAVIETPVGLQCLGAAIQEHAVARFLNRAVTRKLGTGSPMAAWERNLSEFTIEHALSCFEGTLPFLMTSEQRQAVKCALRSPVFIISGGAGTGKTTTLLAMLAIFDQLSQGMVQFQVALTGRAAQRMSESTGRPATTIAKLISDHLGDNKPDLPDHLLLVIDEASMVDLLTAYKVVGLLPYATRIVLVGDVAQLPPISGGLFFHAAMNSTLPVFELTQVKRQRQDSGIHQLATAIRINNFQHVLLNSASSDCIYNSDSTPERILEEWENAGGAGGCILLTPTRKGVLGVDHLNKLIQSQRDSEERPALHYMDDLRGWIPWITHTGAKLHLGDQIMITSNDYNADIRNGDLGTIIEVYADPEKDFVGQMEINGQIIDITSSTLDIMDLGYAITIHKSQGSQWPICILLLPGYMIHMLDQTLLYTAVTRAAERLVILGDSSLVTSALKRGSVALRRHTNIENLLIQRPQEI